MNPPGSNHAVASPDGAGAGGLPASADAVRALPAEFVKRHRVLPVKIQNGTLHMATATPGNQRVIDDIRLLTGLEVEETEMPAGEIAEKISAYYQVTVEKMIEDLSPTRLPNGDGKDLHDIEVMANEPTVVNLVNLIISTAVRERASDIHLVPFEHSLQLRYRVDGLLQEKPPPAAAASRRARLAHQNHGGHEHRRALHAAGRAHSNSSSRRARGHPRRHHADDLR